VVVVLVESGGRGREWSQSESVVVVVSRQSWSQSVVVVVVVRVVCDRGCLACCCGLLGCGSGCGPSHLHWQCLERR
jgi:hypothetical protein